MAHRQDSITIIDCKMDDASPLQSTIEKWSECISAWLLPSWVNDVIWSPSLCNRDSFGAGVCAVVSRGRAAESTPAQTAADQIIHNDTPRFYSIKLQAKIKLITKTNNWTYISVLTTILNNQNHILKNCIGSVIICFILTEVQFVYMERAGFMTCTEANHQGAIK